MRCLPAVMLAGCLQVAAALADDTFPDVDDGDDHVVILVYHHVATDTPASTSIAPGQFSRQMQYLDEHGYQVLSLTEVLWRLDEGKTFPRNSVAITFDDAYLSVYDAAWPLLREYDWPFSVFVSTDYIDRDFGHYMSWEQLQHLSAAGVLIGNHGVTHASALAGKNRQPQSDWLDSFSEDVQQAAERIRAETGVAPRIYAWPYGEFNDDTEQILAELGMYAVGQQSGPAGFDSSLTAVPRFPVSPGFAELEVFAERLQSEPLPLAVKTAPDRLLEDGGPPTIEFFLDDPRYDLGRVHCFSNTGKDLALTRRGDHSFTVTADDKLPAGRSKYTCTAPHNGKDGVYGWYSHLWIFGAAE